MNKEALNKKLAEFAGFVKMEDIYKGDRYTVGWEYPDDSELGKLPNFPESLDACFKWLVPKLDGFHIDMLRERKYSKTKLYFATTWIEGGKHGVGEDDKSPALALCLAIEKLIDGGK